MKQPWLGKPVTDILFILLPPFGCLLFIALFPGLFQNNSDLSDAWWVLLVLLVDVAHVYSTLYRTYFDSNAIKQYRSLLISIPVIAFVAGVLLYSINGLLFWRLLAYVAVFHFIRQQYGFMRLYSRKENIPAIYKRIDTATIYYATLYPILYWHLTSPKNFNWFVAGDFFFFKANGLLAFCTWLYYLLLVVYVAKEVILYITHKQFNIPRVTVIVGTLLSWYFGIVYFNGDMAFTLLNVISHGIPYIALIWIYGKKQQPRTHAGNRILQLVFSRYGIVLFLLIIFMLAYVEEGLWDMTVWKEHTGIFPFPGFHFTGKTVLNILVPLLAVPQITHYIIDGFIWRIKQQDIPSHTT